MRKVVTIVFYILFSTTLQASELEGKFSRLSIKMPNEFKLHKDFLGLPYVFIKNEKNSKKTSISVVPTGIEKINLETQVLEKNYDQYKIGRKKWASKRGFQIKNFFEFDTLLNKSDAIVVFAGYMYKNSEGFINIEQSFYILCPKEAFQLKLLTEKNSKTQSFLKLVREKIKNSTCL